MGGNRCPDWKATVGKGGCERGGFRAESEVEGRWRKEE